MSGPFLIRSYIEMSSWISNPRWFPVWTEQFPVWFERRQLPEVPGHPELSNHCFPRSHSRHPKFKQSATGKTQSKLFWESYIDKLIKIIVGVEFLHSKEEKKLFRKKENCLEKRKIVQKKGKLFRKKKIVQKK